MNIFKTEPKKDIILRCYPHYILLGRILEKDVEEFLKTHNESLILYRFCFNGRIYVPNDDTKKRNSPGSALTPR